MGSLLALMAGVIRAPRRTFAAIAESPRWAGVLALTMGVTFLCTIVLLETEVGRLALLDQWERSAVAFGQVVDDARYATLVRVSEYHVLHAASIALASGPLLVFGLSLVLFATFNRLGGGLATYGQVVGIVAYAGVILALRQVVATPLQYSRETLASPTTLNLLFAGLLDEASPSARFMGVIDLFAAWWAAAVALGMAVLYRRPAWPMVAAGILAYLAAAALLVLVMALSGGTA